MAAMSVAAAVWRMLQPSPCRSRSTRPSHQRPTLSDGTKTPARSPRAAHSACVLRWQYVHREQRCGAAVYRAVRSTLPHHAAQAPVPNGAHVRGGRTRWATGRRCAGRIGSKAFSRYISEQTPLMHGTPSAAIATAILQLGRAQARVSVRS